MAHVEIYTKPTCPYCHRAKALLDQKQVTYEETDITQTDGARDTMIQRSGRQTVPQIFIDDQAIGGCDDLHALNDAGKLDKLLGITS